MFEDQARANTIFCFLLLVILFMPHPAAAYHYEDSDTGADYLLIGVGVFRQNLTSIDGDAVSFGDGDDGLPSDYSNRSYLSLYGDGNLNHDWTFDLKSTYDQEDPDQRFKFLLNLYNGDNQVIVGDHEDGTFLETTFTASDDKMRGATLHGETDKLTGTVMAGAVRGESTTDEIRADGTSGRYRLSEAPVIRGSETVRIEFRDKSNLSRIIKSSLQSAGRDYTIDYDRGEILFNSPVDESDFRGNPVFIVVSYQYDAPGDTYQRSRYGLRSTYSSGKIATIGATYLADGPFDSGFSSETVDDRQQIIGTDLNLNFDDRHQVYMELARSETPSLGVDNDALAMRTDFVTRPIQDLKLFGNYWRVGKDFLTFGSRDLDSGNVRSEVKSEDPFYFKSRSYDFNLDPNISTALSTDMESYGLSGQYNVGYHTISSGARRSRDNIPDDSNSPTTYTDSIFTSVTRIHPEQFDYLLGTEINFRSGEGVDAVGDSRTSRLISGVSQDFGGFDWSGPIVAEGVYQYEQYDDESGLDASTNSHDALGRLEIQPMLDVTVYGEQGISFLYEDNKGDYTERKDTSLIGVEGKINRYIELISSIRYETKHDLIASEKNNTRQTYELKWISKPFDGIKTAIRGEYQNDEDHLSDLTTQKTLLGGELWWDVTSELQFTFSYDREFNKYGGIDLTGETSSYDDVLFRLDWNPLENITLFAYYRLEYDELETEPLDPTRVKTVTELLGGKYQISEDFKFISAYRRKALNDDANNNKIKIYGELAYKINQYLSVAPGYEYSRYNQENGEGEYEANILYISLIGKL